MQVDRMASSSNGLSEAEIQMNLKALKKLDPCIQAIMAHSSQVQLYKYISKNSSDGDWVQTKVAGALFVYQREAAPKYGFLIMNRNSKENMVEVVTTELTFQNEKLGDASQGGAFLLYRKTKPADGSFSIFGIWFCNEGECEAVSVKIKDIQKVLARQEALRQKVNEEERGLMMGGAGKLGELFKSAETSSSKSGGQKQQQQQNLGQLFKSAQSEPAGKTHLNQKNLPNMATVEASPPSQGGLQLMRLLGQSGDVQTQVPAPIGPGVGPMVHTMNHPAGAPMMTDHGAPLGFPGPTLGQHRSAPGQTGPAGPTPPLEEDRGATSASVLDFFAKASTQSSTSPHHQMMEASAFTSVPPPPLISGGPPPSLPAPRTLLPPAGPPSHQGGMPQGVTALPISEGLSMGYIPVSLPGIQETHVGPVPGMHSVESVEAEQRRGGTTASMGGSLSDLSNQLMNKLQVASSAHKPQAAQASSQNQGVTLLSPQVFASPSPSAPDPVLSNTRASASPRHHQPDHLTSMAPPFHHTLSPAQMVEAMKYMLETDAHFVQRLHEAYTMSVQRRLHQNGHH